MRFIGENDGRLKTFFPATNYFQQNLLRSNYCKSVRDRITRLFGDNSGKTIDGEQAGNRFELLRQRKYDDDTNEVSIE